MDVNVKFAVSLNGKDITHSVTLATLTRGKGQIYSVIELEARDVSVMPEEVRDGRERIVLSDIVDGTEIKMHFMIDDIDYRSDRITKIVGKSVTAKMTEEYTGKNGFWIDGDSGTVIRELFSLVGETPKMDDYTSVGLGGGYLLENISLQDAVLDVCSITRAEVWHDGMDVVVSDKQSIKNDSVPVHSYTSVRNIEEFSVTRTDASSVIDEIYINCEPVIDIFSEPSMTLEVDKSPHPLSPKTVLCFTEDESGTVYKIKPVSAKARLFVNPLGEVVEFSGARFEKKDGYGVVERIEIENRMVRLKGGIKSIRAVAVNDILVNDYTYEPGHNVVVFGEDVSGMAKVSYTTDIYQKVFPPSDVQDSAIDIDISMADQSISYRHRYEAVDYWPIGYRHLLDLVSEWYIDENDAINASGDLLSIDEDGRESVIGGWTANAFGEVDIVFSDYGCYALRLAGYENLYIQFYANMFRVGLTKVAPA
ncbi:MAG: hypothetical protein DRI61_04140 [Chloroflexi bacterium]|nr:MAG: hypothetical protein DRI61_04140 [Chloroflexota bacterium]